MFAPENPATTDSKRRFFIHLLASRYSHKRFAASRRGKGCDLVHVLERLGSPLAAPKLPVAL
ncbi:hypothetical protein [Bradyrhizobium sp.]|uniref:hypothetical protein n=1 Tax=Bradyrhizobium sp. TaxID=376 RepID=UPI003BAFB6A8